MIMVRMTQTGVFAEDDRENLFMNIGAILLSVRMAGHLHKNFLWRRRYFLTDDRYFRSANNLDDSINGNLILINISLELFRWEWLKNALPTVKQH